MLTIKQITEAAYTVAREYPITKIELFGSYAKGTNTPESDVDFLVEFGEGISLLTLCGLKNRLEELLNAPVDVIHAPIPQNSILEVDKVVELYAA